MNQIDMMDDGVMAIHQDVPSNSGILGSMPEENISHRRTYDYTSELRNNYSTVTQNGESVTYVRFRQQLQRVDVQPDGQAGREDPHRAAGEPALL